MSIIKSTEVRPPYGSPTSVYLRLGIVVIGIVFFTACVLDTSGLYGTGNIEGRDGAVDTEIGDRFPEVQDEIQVDSMDRSFDRPVDESGDSSRDELVADQHDLPRDILPDLSDRLDLPDLLDLADLRDSRDARDALLDVYRCDYIPNIEICNGFDDDCDGETDEGLGSITCGIGACSRTVQGCLGGMPQTCTPGTPAAEEDCRTVVDDDCDGEANERDGLNCVRFYYEGDGDSYGASDYQCWCATNGPYTATRSGDCDDGRDSVYPGAIERCNGRDDDCDSNTDEGCPDGGRD